MGLLGTFVVAFAAALIYQKAKGRDWGKALHLSTVFGLASMLIVFLGVLVVDGAGLLPAPTSAG